MSYLRSERRRESQDWGRQRTLTIGATTSRHFSNHYVLDVLTTVKWRPASLTVLRHGFTLSYVTVLLKHDLMLNSGGECAVHICRDEGRDWKRQRPPWVPSFPPQTGTERNVIPRMRVNNEIASQGRAAKGWEAWDWPTVENIPAQWARGGQGKNWVAWSLVG